MRGEVLEIRQKNLAETPTNTNTYIASTLHSNTLPGSTSTT